MDSEKSIDLLKEQLYTSKTNYYWEHIGSDGNYSPLIRWLLALFIGLFLPIFLMIVGDIPIWSSGFWFCFILASMGILITRYLFMPDKHRCYHLTSMGIHYTEQDMIPKVAYKIVRGFAWVGIVVCIIAVFVLGPIAFVGAGAFALMSFGMTNFQPTINKSYVLIGERSVVFNLTNDSVLSFGSPSRETFDYVGNVFTATLDQKIELLSHLQSTFPEIEAVEIKKLNDKYKHPIYQQDEEAASE